MTDKLITRHEFAVLLGRNRATIRRWEERINKTHLRAIYFKPGRKHFLTPFQQNILININQEADKLSGQGRVNLAIKIVEQKFWDEIPVPEILVPFCRGAKHKGFYNYQKNKIADWIEQYGEEYKTAADFVRQWEVIPFSRWYEQL